jgi:hypothetical protein
MKTIALIDTRLEVPGVSLGILVSTHPDVMAAFAANDAFQKAEASGPHTRTKIVTLKDRLDVGQPVQPAHLAGSQWTNPDPNTGEKSKSQRYSATGSTILHRRIQVLRSLQAEFQPDKSCRIR